MSQLAVWWGDKEYPPSKVLGIGKDVPSLVYGITSGIALLIGVWCIADSNLLNILSGSNINGWRTAGMTRPLPVSAAASS